MKKLVSVLFALLLTGSLAFAEDAAVKVGAWGRLLFAPTAAVSGDVETDDPIVFTGPNWGAGKGMNTGFAVGASNDHIGFAIDLDVNGGQSMDFGDQAKAWVKFNDMVKVQLGMIQGDVLRGKIGDSGFLGALPKFGTLSFTQADAGNDSIFPRFYPKAGMLIDVTPAEGVYIGAALDAPSDETVTRTTSDMFSAIQIGAGYVIPSIGHLRAQYRGGIDTDATATAPAVKAPKYFDVAFAYTGMENLLVDAGLQYQTESKVGKSTFAVAATYKMDALSAVARLLYGFGEKGTDDDPIYQASADLGYLVADPLTVGAEVSYKKEGDPTGLSVSPYAKIGYAGGFLKTAFTYSTFSKSTAGDYSTWAIPIVVQYGF